MKKKYEHPHYNPSTLLDTLKEWLDLPNDAALAKELRVGKPAISKIRHRRCPITAEMLLRMHEASELSIRDLRFLGGDFRWHTGSSSWVLPEASVTAQLSAPLLHCAQAARRRARG